MLENEPKNSISGAQSPEDADVEKIENPEDFKLPDGSFAKEVNSEMKRQEEEME
ncbi:hypothetical protein KC842_01120 [Candidatus Nomurabacteria bacterium]|nr:hypothetical protein [Candidatus Nomurabacteria bacterium]USN94684.1 MAG: hypothetical protein H6791_02920 [Candidatus Nomurabacteria bacterium]